MQVTQAAQGPMHPSVAASLKPLAQLFWRQGDPDTAVALQRHSCDVLDAEASIAMSGECVHGHICMRPWVLIEWLCSEPGPGHRQTAQLQDADWLSWQTSSCTILGHQRCMLLQATPPIAIFFS